MIVMVNVIPAFSGIYGSMHVELPIVTQLLMATSGVVSRILDHDTRTYSHDSIRLTLLRFNP